MEILPGVHRIDGVNGNCYLLITDTLVLIDAGLPGSAPKIIGYIREKLGRNPGEIATIVLTHYHLDHTGGLAELARAAPAAIISVHGSDAPFVRGARSMPLPKGPFSVVSRVLNLMMRYTPVIPGRLLEEGDVIAGLTCIHTPGHTPGSICLFDPVHRTLFSGDTLITSGGNVRGPPTRFTPDMESARVSIERLSHLDFEILLCGHGEPVLSGASGKVKDLVQEWPPKTP